jgi:hypothetical protein
VPVVPSACLARLGRSGAVRTYRAGSGSATASLRMAPGAMNGRSLSQHLAAQFVPTRAFRPVRSNDRDWPKPGMSKRTFAVAATVAGTGP